jgi:hypothetical protein
VCSAFVLFLGDPVDVFVRFDDWVTGVYKDDFEPFVSSVFSNPVTVEDFSVWELAPCPFLSD